MQDAARNDGRSWSVLFDRNEALTDHGVGLPDPAERAQSGSAMGFWEEATVIDSAAALGVPPAPSMPEPVRATPTPPPFAAIPKGRAIHVMPSAAHLRRELEANAALLAAEPKAAEPKPAAPIARRLQATGALRERANSSANRMFLLSSLLIACMFAHYFIR